MKPYEPLCVKWNCPDCKHLNEDDYENTVFPLCEKCNQTFDWSQITINKEK